MISLEWLELELSNFAYRWNMSSDSFRKSNHPEIGVVRVILHILNFDAHNHIFRMAEVRESPNFVHR